MDCSNGQNRIVGQFPKLAKDLRRAYVRRSPGRLISTSYLQAGKVFRASGTRSRRTSGQVEVFYPGGAARITISKPFPRHPISTRVLGRGKKSGIVLKIPVKPGDWSITIRSRTAG